MVDAYKELQKTPVDFALLAKAAQILIEDQKASTSHVQRSLAIGYSHRSAIGSRAGAMGLPRRSRSTDTGKTGGWVQTISLAQFFEQDLRERMEAEAKKRKASQ